MTFNFVVDRIVQGKAYPALAQHSAEPYTAEWRQFAHSWPYTVPVELIEHCVTHRYPHRLYLLTEDFPTDSYYAVGLGFFDFAIDYFALLSAQVRQYLAEHKLQILFYYHEGDNPACIKQRLDELCAANNLPLTSYRFVSANTQAANLANFAYFADHELLYWHRNQAIPAEAVTTNKSHTFTLLSRQHRWWRATVVADLHRANLLAASQWSYNTRLTADDFADNPIEIDRLNIRNDLESFIANGPYRCDALTETQHNDHHLHVAEHYTDSYCNLVLETHFDADQSGGTFLTEKTFKPIKHGQPFVLFAPTNSLQTLRDLGYRTFDHVIDNTYDTITHNTERYLAAKNTVKQIADNNNLDQWSLQCSEDIQHNQTVFAASKRNRIDLLYQQLHSR